MAETAEDAVEDGQVQKKKYLDEQTQGLEKVTDYVEEQEISGLSNVSAALTGEMFGYVHVITECYIAEPSEY